MVQNQFPAKGTILPKGTTIILFFEGGLHRQDNYLMAVPKLLGQRRAEVEELLSGLGFPYSLKGDGVVVWQSLEEGTLVRAGTLIEIILE